MWFFIAIIRSVWSFRENMNIHEIKSLINYNWVKIVINGIGKIVLTAVIFYVSTNGMVIFILFFIKYDLLTIISICSVYSFFYFHFFILSQYKWNDFFFVFWSMIFLIIIYIGSVYHIYFISFFCQLKYQCRSIIDYNVAKNLINIKTF